MGVLPNDPKLDNVGIEGDLGIHHFEKPPYSGFDCKSQLPDSARPLFEVSSEAPGFSDNGSMFFADPAFHSEHGDFAGETGSATWYLEASNNT